MTAEASPSPSRGFRSGYLLPLLVAAGIGALFLVALYSGDPSRLPSALIGKPVPQFSLPPIEGLAEAGSPQPGIDSAGLATGEVSVVNVWASWCGPCIEEQPILVELKKRHGVRMIGINYKDEPAAARRFLARYGNPFDAIGADQTGRASIDWGVYGVPETYVVDGQGQIMYKFVGPLSRESVEDKLLPIIAKVKSGPQG
ncbi:MAG: DsbE family thiol:disulfide interchange protein [Rhodomicrobium sp.]|nr:DsbE family thiol:disulfide interchange protein [Rhodomicrobium sp.]